VNRVQNLSGTARLRAAGPLFDAPDPETLVPPAEASSPETEAWPAAATSSPIAADAERPAAKASAASPADPAPAAQFAGELAPSGLFTVVSARPSPSLNHRLNVSSTERIGPASATGRAIAWRSEKPPTRSLRVSPPAHGCRGCLAAGTTVRKAGDWPGPWAPAPVKRSLSAIEAPLGGSDGSHLHRSGSTLRPAPAVESTPRPDRPGPAAAAGSLSSPKAGGCKQINITPAWRRPRTPPGA